MQLLPRKAREYYSHQQRDNFPEMIERFQKEDWQNIVIFLNAFKFRKPQLLKDSKLILNSDERKSLAVKKEVGTFFVSLLTFLKIDRLSFEKDESLMKDVIGNLSIKLIQFLYGTYESRVSIRACDIQDDMYGLNKDDISEVIGTKDEGFEVSLVTSKGN